MAIWEIDKAAALVQAISGLGFATFSVLHLSGHLLANISFDLSNKALFIFREYYQTPVIEIVIVGGCLVIHVFAGYIRLIIRTNSTKTLKTPAFTLAINERSWHQWTGHVLTFLIIGHVGSCRIMPYLYLPDPSIVDLTYITFVSNKYPIIFPIYLTVLAASGAYHSIYGISKSCKLLGICSVHLSPKLARILRYASIPIMFSTALALSGKYDHIFIPMVKTWHKLHLSFLKYASLSWLKEMSAQI